MPQKEYLDLSKLSKKDFPFKDKMDREQEDMVSKLFKTKRIIVDSVAGSGKTTILTQAMKVLKDKGYIEDIYYVIFPVQEEALGYLPGDLGAKIKEYAVPFIQALHKAGVNPQELIYERMVDELFPYEYKVVPHTFLRGRTISKAGLIIDEVQNGTIDEIKKTLTRIEDDCYLALAGHNGQIDIAKERSGFAPYIHHFKQGKESGIYTEIEFARLTTNYRGAFSSFSDQISSRGYNG